METNLNSKSNAQSLPYASHDHNTMLSDGEFVPSVGQYVIVSVGSGSRVVNKKAKIIAINHELDYPFLVQFGRNQYLQNVSSGWIREFPCT